MNCYRKLCAIDAEIDEKPSRAMIKEMVELRNRNLFAFAELQQFNDTGKFLYRHPLIINESLRAELADLLKRDPGQFLEDFSKTEYNVRRYKSFLNSKSRGDDKRELDQENLKRHQDRVKVFKEVLQSNDHG